MLDELKVVKYFKEITEFRVKNFKEVKYLKSLLKCI